MAGKTTNNDCQSYLNSKKRVVNKQKRLEKRLDALVLARENPKGDNLINPNTKEEPKRRPIENIKKSCRIGTVKEGFAKEDFKFRPRKGLKNEQKIR